MLGAAPSGAGRRQRTADAAADPRGMAGGFSQAGYRYAVADAPAGRGPGQGPPRWNGTEERPAALLAGGQRGRLLPRPGRTGRRAGALEAAAEYQVAGGAASPAAAPAGGPRRRRWRGPGYRRNGADGGRR